MKKCTLKRLLCTIVATLMLVALVACDSPEDRDDDKKKDKVSDNAQKLRDGLIAYNHKGLTFYLSDEYEDVHEGWVFNNDGEDVEVEYLDLSDTDSDWGEYFNEDISTSKDLALAFEAMLKDSDCDTNVKVDKKHGVYYVWTEGAQEAAGEAMVYGCYVDGDSAWAILVEIVDFEEASEEKIETMIDYATLGEIDK